MKQKAERWNSILYSILSLLQAIIFVYLKSNNSIIFNYLVTGIVIIIIYYNIPNIVNFLLEPKGVKTHSNISDAYSFHEEFLPFLLNLNKLLNNKETVAKIKLYHDWKYAVENLIEIIEHSKYIKDNGVSYNNNYIYVGELEIVTNYLLNIYQKTQGFKIVIEIYNCETMETDISEKKNFLTKFKKNNMEGTNTPINELKN